MKEKPVNIVLPHEHNKNIDLSLIKKELENIDNFQILADIFKQLGDMNRLRIFWLLCHCEECVCDISALLGMSSPAVSHHLRILKSSKLIVGRRQGKEVIYKSSGSEQSKLLHKMIENSMLISCISPKSTNASQEALIHQVHDYLVEHIDQRITIEAIAQQFAINTTTLKEQFKEVYGTSLAFHIKEHRMELAAKLLTETNLSLSEIAKAVGYDSQSKFSAAFKEIYNTLPSKYRVYFSP